MMLIQYLLRVMLIKGQDIACWKRDWHVIVSITVIANEFIICNFVSMIVNCDPGSLFKK